MIKYKRKRGIYLLPNLLTTIGLLLGFYAIVLAINGYYQQGAMMIFIAMIFDGLDGRIARLIDAESDFGAQYDSMSDMLSFGIAPALLVWSWSLSDLGNIGWLAAFLYIASATLRLARFNAQIGIEDKSHFQGLPSPAAAALNAGLVWFVSLYQIPIGYPLSYIALFVLVMSSLLMVSNVRYQSFKMVDLKNRASFKIILLALLVITLISLQPAVVLFSMVAIYTLSGLLLTTLALRKKRKQKHKYKK